MKSSVARNYREKRIFIRIKDDAIIICPVDETGKYSVIPSITAKMIVSIRFINYFFGFAKIA